MAIDIQVLYKPRVIEHFDIRVDNFTMLKLIQTLHVACRELAVDESIPELVAALVAQYDLSADGEGSTNAAVDGDGAAA